eukprot:gnl/TRDRNA2_/TRDRNA2_81896_c0_seq1.p1 gnl/TRDRNA2_/TRDRNA2_81896_c0~~gnl/TRDRNA2_/TRDRNA2_81896_c0_seq1.p1  ORF type:complete len:442 (+),score=54.48 gnl/TRDRNA2_/TRDRNA2_81896_c0_seq1:80-1405(+)
MGRYREELSARQEDQLLAKLAADHRQLSEELNRLHGGMLACCSADSHCAKACEAGETDCPITARDEVGPEVAPIEGLRYIQRIPRSHSGSDQPGPQLNGRVLRAPRSVTFEEAPEVKAPESSRWRQSFPCFPSKPKSKKAASSENSFCEQPLPLQSSPVPWAPSAQQAHGFTADSSVPSDAMQRHHYWSTPSQSQDSLTRPDHCCSASTMSSSWPVTRCVSGSVLPSDSLPSPPVGVSSVLPLYMSGPGHGFSSESPSQSPPWLGDDVQQPGDTSPPHPVLQHWPSNGLITEPETPGVTYVIHSPQPIARPPQPLVQQSLHSLHSLDSYGSAPVAIGLQSHHLAQPSSLSKEAEQMSLIDDQDDTVTTSSSQHPPMYATLTAERLSRIDADANRSIEQRRQATGKAMKMATEYKHLRVTLLGQLRAGGELDGDMHESPWAT